MERIVIELPILEMFANAKGYMEELRKTQRTGKPLEAILARLGP